MVEIILVEDIQNVKNIVEEIINSCTYIGLDFEKVEDEVTLIQIAPSNKRVYIFDVYKKPLMISDLKMILTSTKIVKIMQDCRNDNKHLLETFKVQLVNVFDVQVGHYVIKKYKTPRHLRTSEEYAGLNEVCRYFGIEFTKNKIDYSQSPRIWMERPLSQFMLNYAAEDAYILVDIYHKMEKMLKNENELFTEFKRLCEERLN